MIELMSALLIFGIITLGITPVLIGSVRGAALSRAYTVGKNLALQSMERARGLPYFISYATQNQKVDLLDLYFPDVGGGYDATNMRFVTTCTSATAASRACPPGLSEDYTVTYHASFVEPLGSTPESYATVAPSSAYAWNSVTADLPPARILKFDVIVSWAFQGNTKSYTLSSLLGDRKVAEERVSGSASVDYVVQALTSYKDSSGRITDLTAKFGDGESRIETRLLSEAEVTARGANLRLVRPAQGAVDDSEVRATLQGAISIYGAPPDTADPAATATLPGQNMAHPDLNNNLVAGLAPSRTTTPLRAKVSDELPAAAGGFALNDSSKLFDGWVNVKAALGNSTALRLDATPLSVIPDPQKPMLSLKRVGGVSLAGATSATTGAMGTGDRRVQTTATGSFPQMGLLPVSFIGGGNPEDRTLIQVLNFTGTADCKSTGSPTAYATPSYSATLKFWAEADWSPTNQFGNGVTSGAYRTVNLAGTNTTDPLGGYGPSPDKNPLVWEDPLSIDPNGSPFDIYLFPISHDHGPAGPDVLDHDHPGYLDPAAGWSSLVNISSGGEVLAEGKTTNVSLPGAITINTVPLDPNVPSSNLQITIGKMACTASDFR